MSDSLVIAGRSFRSRLIVGTGKYKSFQETARALESSGAEMVTVAVRRVNLDRSKESLLDYIDAKKYFLLPNTAGCYTADEAIRAARLGREVGLSDWVKLEVIGDQATLYPDVQATLEATRVLVKEGFTVLPYTSDDIVFAKRLIDAGAATIMPLGAPIGSGMGIQNQAHIKHSSGDDHRSPSDRRCRSRYGLRCGHRHGTRSRRCPDEHRHRQCAGSRAHGRSHETRRPRRTPGLSLRPHAEEAVRNGEFAVGRRSEVIEELRNLVIGKLKTLAFAFSITQLPNFPITQSKQKGGSKAAPISELSTSTSEHLHAFHVNRVLRHVAADCNMVSFVPLESVRVVDGENLRIAISNDDHFGSARQALLRAALGAGVRTLGSALVVGDPSVDGRALAHVIKRHRGQSEHET